MRYVAEFAGSLVFLLGGYAYMCNVSLKKTLVSTLNYVELVIAWSLAVGLGLTTAVIMGGPAYLNPGVVFGNIITGALPVTEALIYLLMEFLAAGAAEILCMVFFWDSFKASPNMPKRGIFSAYPVEKNMVLNFVQEIMATFAFLFLVFTCLKATSGDSAALQIGVVGFAAVAILALTLNSTGFSMNAMRSVFSSVWFAILPFPNKNGEKVDWPYQLIVNLVGSSIGGILAVLVTGLF
ncbi:MAG: aquaporin [Eubacterium sp.]|nr:aquaporin [Eubacterium sp.]MCM1216338.1 aquaporin [Lachnospiraceae bacterium]MCM1305185.1 aquaporin [Butyrivibrio sp.]MCM1342891.1 aquaporin [Muribaculaceae bacterium]MCM1240105.1 aquaporin [Lachnospiraceae bacterium]